MRLRTVSILLTTLAISVFLGAGLVAAHPRVQSHVADAAVSRTFYVSGSLITLSGSPMSLSGLATVMVTTTGDYSGTMVMAGPKPATLQVTGSISGSTMTLSAMVGSQSLSATAHGVVDRLGDRAKDSPITTVGNEFQGAATLGSSTTGWLTAIDTSIMRTYGFAAVVSHGSDHDAILNGALMFLADRYGDLHGYFQRDSDGALFPLRSGTLNRGQLIVHIDLMNAGQVVGAATLSRSVVTHQVIYKGTFGGPSTNDTGAWFSAPPD